MRGRGEEEELREKAVLWKNPTAQSDRDEHPASVIVPSISLLGSRLPYTTETY